jgi:hypothetical protein
MRSHRGVGVALGIVAALTWLVSMASSLVASPDYTAPVSLALVSAALHFAAVMMLLRRGRSPARFLWLLPALPLALFTVDNLGRLSSLLGGPPFRLLI